MSIIGVCPRCGDRIEYNTDDGYEFICVECWWPWFTEEEVESWAEKQLDPLGGKAHEEAG